MQWSYYNPVRIEIDSIDGLTKHIKGQRVLLVTTSGFVQRGTVNRIRSILESCTITVWDEVKPNPDLEQLYLATKQLKGLNFEVVIGLGGGSAIDSAKVLATTIPTQVGPSIIEVLRHNVKPMWAKRLGLITIPTTSGTGAEVTPFATVWDHKNKKKYSLAGEHIYPDIAFIDTSLTLSLNNNDTLYPALDTISHALESLWNINATLITKSYANQALELSAEALPLVLDNLNNLDARCKLQMASVFAGLAISQTKTAIAHAISYSLTSLYGMPHGLACSIFLEEFISEYKKINCCYQTQQNLTKVENLLNKLCLFKMVPNYCTIESLLEKLDVNQDRIKNSLILFDKSKIEKFAYSKADEYFK